MRALALTLLLLGPVLSGPAAAALLARQLLSEAHLSEVYAVSAAAVVLVVEVLLLRRRGLLRQVAVLALSSFWAMWAWQGLTEPHFQWSQLPHWRSPDRGGEMVIIIAIIAYLMLYELADSKTST